MTKFLWAASLVFVLAGSQTVIADVWDLDSINDEDDSSGTDNEVSHGTVQVHDLAAEAAVADQDWYVIYSRPYSSYEVLVEGLTGDLTTGYVARFNNSGSQITVLLLQNTGTAPIAGVIYYFTTNGVLAGSVGFLVPVRGLSVIPTANTVPGVSGSIIIANDGRYGELNGKTVALEPATGFSFDTPLVYKPK